MKVLFFGSSDFSVPFLNKIHNSGHTVSLAVTNPDSKSGRGRRLVSNPVKSEALKIGIKFYELTSFNNGFYNFIKDSPFDVIVAVSYGKIIPVKLIDMAQDKTVNVHPSILPKYRGPSPIITALLNGDTLTGISLIKINKTVDTGDIYEMKKVPILIEDNRSTLEEKIIKKAAQMLVGLLDRFENNEINSYHQASCGISYTRIYTKKDTVINWNDSSGNIFNKIRAFGYFPGCITSFKGKTIKILKAENVKFNSLLKDNNLKPGEVVRADKEGLIVTCGKVFKGHDCNKGCFLSIKIIKPQDKNSMDYPDFINGYRIKTGDFFE